MPSILEKCLHDIHLPNPKSSQNGLLCARHADSMRSTAAAAATDHRFRSEKISEVSKSKDRSSGSKPRGAA